MPSFFAAPTHSSARPVTPQGTGRHLQRLCACGQHTGGGECESCKKKRLGLQRLTMNEERSASDVAPPIVHEALRSPGRPLEAGARAAMESRFGRDFSHVRVHTGALAARSAQAVDALAYTVGQDMVFGEGQYAPATPAGRQLLAHELTHTLQQGGSATGGGSALPSSLPIGPAGGFYERQAGRAGANASRTPGAVLQRQPVEEERGRNVGPHLPEMPLPPICSFVWEGGRPYWKCENLPGVGSTPNIPLDPRDIPGEVERRLGKFGQQPEGERGPTWIPNLQPPRVGPPFPGTPGLTGDLLREQCRRYPALCPSPGGPTLGPLLPVPEFTLGPETLLGASMLGSLTLDGFALNSAELTGEHSTELDAHAATLLDLLRRFPNSFITLSGHTDATGREERNLPLSRERAEAVKAALIARGIPEEIISTGGLGASVPRVETGRAEPRNRRVELTFVARNFFNLGRRP